MYLHVYIYIYIQFSYNNIYTFFSRRQSDNAQVPLATNETGPVAWRANTVYRQRSLTVGGRDGWGGHEFWPRREQPHCRAGWKRAGEQAVPGERTKDRSPHRPLLPPSAHLSVSRAAVTRIRHGRPRPFWRRHPFGRGRTLTDDLRDLPTSPTIRAAAATVAAITFGTTRVVLYTCRDLFQTIFRNALFCWTCTKTSRTVWDGFHNE